LNGGASLQPETRQAIMTEANSRMKGYHDAYGRVAKFYSGIATRANVPPEDVVPSFGELAPYAPAPDATTPPPEVETVPDDGAGVVGQTTTQPEGTEAHGSDGNDYVVVNGKWTLKPKGAPNG
jgi:hypothetical protein